MKHIQQEEKRVDSLSTKNDDEPEKLGSIEKNEKFAQKPPTPAEFLENLRANGRAQLIDFNVDEINRRPPWLDEARFSQARETPDGLEPLLSTGNSKDIPSLFNRYLNTIVHVRSWYHHDIFNPETKGYKSIRMVRSMHKRLQQNMNEKFSVNDYEGKPTLWFTQYEVSLTQFSFVGLALAYPEKCGLIGASRLELEMINYYWRVLGFMMGVEDCFNCCWFDNLDDIQAFMRLVLEREFKPRLNQHCPTGTSMCQALCKALSDFITMVTFNSLAHWWSDKFMFNGYEPKPMTIREKLLTQISKFSFNKLFKYESFLDVSTKLHLRRFERKLKMRQQIYKKLVDKYSDYEKYSFISTRFNYLGNSNTNAISNKAASDQPNDTTTNSDQGAREQKDTKINGCPFGFVLSKEQKCFKNDKELSPSCI